MSVEGDSEPEGLTPELYQRLRREARARRGQKPPRRRSIGVPPPQAEVRAPRTDPDTSPPTSGSTPAPQTGRAAAGWGLGWLSLGVLVLTALLGARVAPVSAHLVGALCALGVALLAQTFGAPRWPARIVLILASVLALVAGILLLVTQSLGLSPVR